LCADTETSQATRISVTWREGVEATDWGQVAKRDNLDVIQTELMRLEESVHTIHLELQHIRRKEEEMRDVNGEPRRRRRGPGCWPAHVLCLCVLRPGGAGCARWGKEMCHGRRVRGHCRVLTCWYSSCPARCAEATNARVAYFSIGALVTCLAMAALQLWNMKRFFLRKKLL
jgi:hypothetical protein